MRGAQVRPCGCGMYAVGSAAGVSPRLHHFWREDESTDEKPSLSSLVNCMNHQTNLVVVSSVHIICINTVNSMYTATRFLKMSGHFLRLIAAVRQDGGDTELKNNNIEQ